jgi:hypothetical protein
MVRQLFLAPEGGKVRWLPTRFEQTMAENGVSVGQHRDPLHLAGPRSPKEWTAPGGTMKSRISSTSCQCRGFVFCLRRHAAKPTATSRPPSG